MADAERDDPVTVSLRRTLVVGAETSWSLSSCCDDDPPPRRPLRWATVEPDANLDWSLDITAILADVADTIAEVSWAIAPSGTGERQIARVSVSGGVITGQLVGGVAGRDYENEIIVTGLSGLIWEWNVGQFLDPWDAVFPSPAPPSAGFGVAITWSASAFAGLLGGDSAILLGSDGARLIVGSAGVVGTLLGSDGAYLIGADGAYLTLQ